MCILLFTIATLTFTFMKTIPGDPFQDEKNIPEECLKQLRQNFGLNDPLPIQYGRYIKNLFLFRLGPSLKYPSQTVNEIIGQNFLPSFLLGIEALCIALPLAFLFALLSSFFYRRPIDYLFKIIALLGISMPSFVIATLLQYIFAYRLSLFPIARFDTLSHSILPALTLAIGPMAILLRLIRAQILEVLNQPYILVAYSKGLSEQHIIFFHILKNVSLPIIHYLGPLITRILLGSFIVEKIFAIPGLGQWFVNGVLNRDYPLIGGLTLFYSMTLLFVHTGIDLLTMFLDPRIRKSVPA